MRQIKRIVALMILTYGVFVCSGCSGSSSVSEDFKNTEHSDNTVQNDAQKYKISAKDFDREKVCKTVLDNYDITDIPPEQENGCTVIDLGESSLLIGKGNIDYKKNNSASAIGSLFFYYVIPGLLDTAHDPESEVTVLKDNEEVKEIESEIASICISGENEELNLIRAAKVEKSELQDIASKLQKSGEQEEEITEWEADEYIGLEYEIVKNNIPVMGIEEPDQGYKLEIWAAQPAYIQVLIENGKILYLTVRGLVQSEEPEKTTLISEEEAIQIAEKESEDVISNINWTVKEVKLEYVSVPDWSANLPQPKELIPYWCIIRSYEGEETIEDAVRINAITGGNLSYGE